MVSHTFEKNLKAKIEYEKFLKEKKRLRSENAFLRLEIKALNNNIRNAIKNDIDHKTFTQLLVEKDIILKNNQHKLLALERKHTLSDALILNVTDKSKFKVMF